MIFISLAMYIFPNRWVVVPTPTPMPFNRCKEHAPNEARITKNKKKEVVYIVNTFSFYHIIFVLFFRSYLHLAFFRFYRAYIDMKNKRWKSTCLSIQYPDVQPWVKERIKSELKRAALRMLLKWDSSVTVAKSLFFSFFILRCHIYNTTFLLHDHFTVIAFILSLSNFAIRDRIWLPPQGIILNLAPKNAVKCN